MTPVLATEPCVRRAAAELRRAGVCVLPPRENGSKAPDAPAWRDYQRRKPTTDELVGWYSNERTGVGAVTGAISGNLECLEFDDEAIYTEFIAVAPQSGIVDLIERIRDGYEEITPGGGVHWLYRAPEITGNTKLAARPGPPDPNTGKPTIETLIETRGEGGYIVVAPSHGRVHPSGNPYRLARGGPATIASLTAQERTILWQLARSFDQMPKPKYVPPPIGAREQTEGERPGDDFNRRASWSEILVHHGWTEIVRRGNTTYWRRPGKTVGVSATTNHDGSDLLYIFSSSTPLNPNRGYSKFSAYSLLDHDGDFSAAARNLADQGYGTRRIERAIPLTDPPGPTPLDPNAFHRTDSGNAELFAAKFGNDFRFDAKRREWLWWEGDHWRRGAADRAHGLTKVVARERLRAAADLEKLDERATAAKYALSCEYRKARDAMIDLARREYPIYDETGLWDADPLLFGVANGVIDLKTGTLRPGCREDRITMRSPIVFDPVAAAPRWHRFLHEVFRGDDDLIGFVRRAVGYSLTGRTDEQCIFFCYGTGANGKGTLYRALNLIAGEYAHTAPAKMLEQRAYESGIPNDVAALAGKRFVTMSELPEQTTLNEARIKSLTGQDAISARFLHKEYFTFIPVAKYWLAFNHKPIVNDQSEGFWRRIRLIPFAANFTPDPTLDDQLRAEASGILAWAVRGALEWRRYGLNPPESVREATTLYRTESDPIAEFLDACCVIEPGAFAQANALFITYESWAFSVAIADRRPLGSVDFGKRMAERFTKKRAANGFRYVGVGIRERGR
jgi:putative DNA primase/helicase